MNPLHPSRDPLGYAHLYYHMQPLRPVRRCGTGRPVWKKLYQHYVPKWVDWALVILGGICLLTMGLYVIW